MKRLTTVLMVLGVVAVVLGLCLAATTKNVHAPIHMMGVAGVLAGATTAFGGFVLRLVASRG